MAFFHSFGLRQEPNFGVYHIYTCFDLWLCFTHFSPWMLVHALIMHYTCIVDAPTMHTPYHLTSFAYCQHPGLEWLENHKAFIWPPAMATFPYTRGPLEAPLNNCVVLTLRVSNGALGALSLGGGRLVYLWRYGGNLGQILGDYQR